MEFNEIINKERDILRNTSWYQVLRGFVESKEFEIPFADACHVLNKDKHFFPTLKSVFSPFVYTDYNDCNVVIMNSYYDYDYLSFSNGLALGYKCKAESVYKKLKRNIVDINHKYKKKPGDGEEMAEYATQGVLLLNDCPIIHEDKGLCHRLWEPFYNYLFDMMKKDVIKVSIGDNNTDYGYDLTYKNPLSKKKPFFNEINELLIQKGKKPIEW